MRKDIYLGDFVSYCKKEFKRNLLAIMVYGSYIQRYFDKEKSDYDVFVIFKTYVPSEIYKKKLNQLFPKVTLQYFSNEKDILNLIHKGHWSVYSVLLKGSKIIYGGKGWESFFKQIKEIDFWSELKDLNEIKFKDEFDNKCLRNCKDNSAIKVAYSSIRKRLQMIIHLTKEKLVFSFDENITLNKKFLTRGESIFLKKLNKKLLRRSNEFGIKDKEYSLAILNKLIRVLDGFFMKDSLTKKDIYKEHIKILKNLNIPHKKLIIFFAGIPGSGKTHIAKILERRYKAARVNNDELRRVMRKLYKKKYKKVPASIDACLYDYVNWFIKNYNFPNKLIIADRGIERKYKEAFLLAKRLGYKIFVISVRVFSRKLLEKRVKKKLRGRLDRNFIENIDRWIKENKEFNKNIKPDIVIDNNIDNQLNLDKLIKKLDVLIN